MRIQRLRALHLRCFDEVDLAPGPHLNYLVGSNGSGKTTILEGIYVLSHGRSFRSGTLDALSQHDRTGFAVHAEIASTSGRHWTVGMERCADEWRLRVNGVDQTTLAATVQQCAAVCFEPGSHALITGGAEVRRRFLDWGVFHVEHGFLTAWRNYRRALRQRNALLRANGATRQLQLWESELDRFAGPIEFARSAYVEALRLHLQVLAERLMPELGPLMLHYRPGWDVQQPLAQILEEQRGGDASRGYTRAGPHRADWRIVFQHAAHREYLSRGQIKLAAIACVLAQAALFADGSREWPILCLDDLASELDREHQRLVLEEISGRSMQVWITASDAGQFVASSDSPVFHVERGTVRRGMAPML